MSTKFFIPGRFSPKIIRSTALGLLTLLIVTGMPVLAQESTPTSQSAPATENVVSLPEDLPITPTIAAAEPGQYVLEFNRSPVVGNRLRFQGIYDEQRLHFTRPRNWQATSVKVLLRYRHSAALYATRSNLTVLINGTSIGSVPLNQRQGEIGDAVFEVPTDLLQDHNELVMAALQNNSPTCTQDPFDPSLWTEILPDSKLVFDFQPQEIAPSFSEFPYPLFDDLSLQKNELAYLLPAEADSQWLSATARLQTALGRAARYRPLDNRLVDSLDAVANQERLVVLGTPAQHPLLAELDLPFQLDSGRFIDADGTPLPETAGLLMWTTTAEGQVPILVVTGNGPEGVTKAAQYLVQPADRQIATGPALVVNQVAELASPDPRYWPSYLPDKPEFKLSDLSTPNGEAYGDITVRGSHSPALKLDFKALPDDQFLPGSQMVLHYSYGPQINPLTSLVEVELDGVTLEGARLTEVEGAEDKRLTVNLPPDRITPTSELQVNFRLDPRERRSCSRVTDQQLWGTIHSDTEFRLQREAVTRLPDLAELQTGFPFTAPQDLSTAAAVLPNQPSKHDIQLLLEMAERLGRLSRADSVQLDAYIQADLPETVQSDRNLIVIGTEERFPFPELLKDSGFTLQDRLTRRWGESQIQPLGDDQGLLKAVLSPWSDKHIALALSARNDQGLAEVGALIRHDPLFYQLEGDTALISAQVDDPDPYDAAAYRLEFLRQSPQVQLATTTTPWIWRLSRTNWLLLMPATIVLTLLIYAAAQNYLYRSRDDQ